MPGRSSAQVGSREESRIGSGSYAVAADLCQVGAVRHRPVDRVRRVVRVPDLTHLLRPDPGTPSLRTYKQQVRQPVDPRVLNLVGQWLSEQARSSTRSSQEDPA